MGIFDYLIMDARVQGLADRISHVHERSQARLEDDLASIREEQRALRRDLEQLALYTRATVSVLADRGVIDQEALIERMTEIDRGDGVEDGRLGR